MMNFAVLKKVVTSATKGSFHSMLWERPMKTKKMYSNHVIIKRSYGVVRFGVEYDNMKAVQAKRESGELPAVNQGLRWGTWALYPYFVQHNEKMYLRCATSQHNRIQSEYFLDGVKVDKSVVEKMCLASEFHQTDALDVFTVNVENILSIR